MVSNEEPVSSDWKILNKPRRVLRKQVLTFIACSILCVGTSWGQGNLTPTKKAKTEIQQTSRVSRTGTATWYGESYHNRKMANGKIYNMWDPTTVATNDRRIPFGTRIRVTNIATGKSIIVVVRDRMARNARHTLDLSVAGFTKLAPRKQGVIKIKYEILK